MSPARDRRLRAVAAEAEGCTACELHELGTQTVFGEGPAPAPLMLVGEQPGDREDVEGHPFVGPAGQLLDRGLRDAGVSRDQTYVTNVVKHFRWEGTRGTRRLHKKPSVEHVRACWPWFEKELELVDPDVVVCLGATAAKALLGPSFTLTRHRGELVEWDREPLVTATVHPSAVLRAGDDREKAYDAFVTDLRFAGEAK